jgi:hypothetical protein
MHADFDCIRLSSQTDAQRIISRMPTHIAGQSAIAELLRSFPDVPPRIIASVLASYLPLKATVAEAVEACHHRLIDACAA